MKILKCRVQLSKLQSYECDAHFSADKNIMDFLLFEQDLNSTVSNLELSPCSQPVQSAHSLIDNTDLTFEGLALSPPTSIKNSNTNANSNKSRRVRTIFSNKQILGLENEYRLNVSPCRRQRFVIAEQLDLNERQVKYWFQNRRAKTRKRILASPNVDKTTIQNAFPMSEENVDCTEAHEIDTFVQNLLYDNIPKNPYASVCSSYGDVNGASDYTATYNEQNVWSDQIQLDCATIISETTSSDSYNEFHASKKNIEIIKHDGNILKSDLTSNCESTTYPKTIETQSSMIRETTSSDSYNEFQDFEKAVSIVKKDDEILKSGLDEGLSSSPVSKHNKGNRARTIFSSEQFLRLENEYHTNPYPSRRQRCTIAEQLGLNDRQVKYWFQNRRAKTRLSIKKRTLTSSSLDQQLNESVFTMPLQNNECTEGHDIDSFIQSLLYDDIPKNEPNFPCSNFTQYNKPSCEQNFWIDQMAFNCGLIEYLNAIDTKQIESLTAESITAESYNKFQEWGNTFN